MSVKFKVLTKNLFFQDYFVVVSLMIGYAGQILLLVKLRMNDVQSLSMDLIGIVSISKMAELKAKIKITFCAQSVVIVCWENVSFVDLLTLRLIVERFPEIPCVCLGCSVVSFSHVELPRLWHQLYDIQLMFMTFEWLCDNCSDEINRLDLLVKYSFTFVFQVFSSNITFYIFILYFCCF